MRNALTVLLTAIVCALTATTAFAQQDDLVVSRGNVDPLPIAAPPFSGAGPYGGELAGIVRDNLGRSGLFAPIDPLRYIDQNVNGAALPTFSNWSLIGSQYLVTGVTNQDPDGRLRVDFRLWDINSEQQLLGLQFAAPAENWRRIGHKISDAVYQELTGLPGYFDTRIAFVGESGPRTLRRRELCLMDQDGYNPQCPPITDAQVFTPRFSSTGRQLVYMALRDSGSQLLLLDFETQRQESLGTFEGTVFAPQFSPDASRVAFSMARYGNTDIFIANARAGGYSRLTSDPGIDTSPSYSPDGGQIVFNSDRAGSPQLYIMNTDGSGQRRLSLGGGSYTTPAWSPDGQWIAFTKQNGNTFHIGIMRPDGSGERLLTSSYLDEGPSWAPNSRILMFFREAPGSGARLWTVDLQGREQPAPYFSSGSDPSWSPLLE